MISSLAGDDREVVELFFKCSNLVDTDFFGKSDPRAVLYSRKDANSPWVKIGNTETIQNQLNPNFNTAIQVEFIFETHQYLKVQIEDEDGKNDDVIGSAEFELGQVMMAPGFKFQAQLQNKTKASQGVVVISAQKFVKDAYTYHIDLKAKGVKDIEWFSKSDPFLRIYRPKPGFQNETSGEKIPDQEWYQVVESEFKKDETNPDFKPFSVSSNSLCRGNVNMVLKVEFWDHSGKGEHEFLGRGFFTVAQLQKEIKEIPTFDQKNKNSGMVLVEKFTAERTYDMVDWLRGGLNLNLVVSIDYTASNGDPKDSKSLHFVDQNSKNDYEKTIESVGSVILAYDKDRNIPTFGFGAKMPQLGYNTEVNHFFPLQTPGNQPCTNITQILQAYAASFSYVELSGPTMFAPTLKGVMSFISQAKQKDPLAYGILLILTDGCITDFNEAIEMIVDASSLPLSILIVGVGNEDFENMRILDGDNTKISDQRGRSPVRDIVQFVEINKKQNVSQLSEDLLKELPRQITEYFRINKMTPIGHN